MKRPKLRWIAAFTLTAAIVTGTTVAFAGEDDIPEGPSLSDVKKFGEYGKAAYGAYQLFFGEHELTLDEAMAQILNAVNTAKTEILSRIDQVSASTVSACSRHAVIDFANLDRMDNSGRQLYASNSVQCVAEAWARIPNATDKAAIDQMGFALNVVGPLALISQAKVFGADNPGRGPLVDTIVQANNATIAKLQPQCFAGKGEIIGNQQELNLLCTAYNGDEGTDNMLIGKGQQIPTNIDNSTAIGAAVARTSVPVALASLDGLLPDPVVTAPGNQATYVGDTVDLKLSASGGTAPYTWSAAGLPAGITVTSTGKLTGKPTANGTKAVTITATDANKQRGSVSITWTVAPPVAILGGVLSDRASKVGEAVNLTPNASAGAPPYTWSATGLPAGLRIDAASGQITGTLKAAAVNSVTVTVTDATGRHSSRTFTWTVNAPTVQVPNVAGQTPAEATSKLKAAGLTVTAQTVRSCVDPGRVESQNPAAGAAVAPGTNVKIFVAQCSGNSGGGGADHPL